MYGLVERALIPDPVVRLGIKALLSARLNRKSDVEAFREKCRTGSIALSTELANEQHYEVPTELFKLMLGPRMKYSSCYWGQSLEEAEDKSLELSVEHARLENGQRVLDVGCGWGSLSCYIASRFPESQVISVSNSKTQKDYIDSLGYKNIEVITSDINNFEFPKVDRVVSVEAFEHMRNYKVLFSKLGECLEPDGLLFFHVFNHKSTPYFFEDGWMADNFFTGGTMLSEDIIPILADGFREVEHWRWNGRHYGKTLRAWLDNLDRNYDAAVKLLGSKREVQKWRLFLMACEELFNYSGGTEWYVTHWLFECE